MSPQIFDENPCAFRMILYLRALKILTEFVRRIDGKTCNLGDEIKRNA